MIEMVNDKINNIPEEYSQYWKNRFEKKKEELKKRKQVLRECAEKCGELLKKKYGAKKVYIIGSLVRERRIHDKTDIDLVVVGLSDQQYFSALNSLYRVIPKGIDIDLITKETANDWMKKIIEKEGVEI